MKPVGLKQLQAWVSEAETAHSLWRRESWTDCRFKDGEQWTEQQIQKMMKKNINPLTINRIFPIINLITGNFANNQHDIVAVGRTQEDSEISQVMSESVAFVMDQYHGYDAVFNAFTDQVVPGFGAMGVTLNNDPRKEKVKVRQYPWYSIWWDPFSDPWMETDNCRYAYYADWKDLEAVKQMFPEKAKTLDEHFSELVNSSPGQMGMQGNIDEGSIVEDKRRILSQGAKWADKERKRVRPVEMWYTVVDKAWFAKLPSGHVYELTGDARKQFEMVRAADQCVCATVKKMRVATFVGNVLLEDTKSPYKHDQYPFVPFVGYLDSFGFPYGVPRQVREMNMEVNKRRSMALSLISNRRVIMERNTSEDHNATYDQANQADGLIILNDGKSDTFQIQEMQSLAAPQVDMLNQSEREIQEITGANDESMGIHNASQSAVALENKQQRSSTMTANLMKNLRRSQRMLGERVISMVQTHWTEPKVLRVTDRVTGAERFAALNDPYFNANTGRIDIRNNITVGRYDVVVTEKPMTDTIRQKNLENIFSAIQKAPPEAIAPLLNLAFELSDLPNKEQLLHQLRLTLGVEPIDPLLSAAEADAKAKEKQAQLEEQQAIDAKMTMDERQAEIDKIMAEVQLKLADAELKRAQAAQGGEKNMIEADKAQTQKESTAREDYMKGVELAEKIKQSQSLTKPKPQKEAA